MIYIRRLANNEYEIYRSIRLESLKEDPYAYTSKYEEAITRESSKVG